MTNQEVAKLCHTLIASLVKPEDRLSVAGLVVALAIGPEGTIAVIKHTESPVVPIIIPNKGKIKAGIGERCHCQNCKKDVYEIISPVYENMGTNEFNACYKPIGHTTQLPRMLDILPDESGNIATNCPVCNGKMSLWIIGRGDSSSFEGPTGDNIL